MSTPVFFRLWGIPFVLVGLYLILGRFLADSMIRARTYYGLTNHRIVIVSGIFVRQVKSLALQGLVEITMSENQLGRGSVIFGTNAPFAHNVFGSGWPGSSWKMAPSFDSIEHARSVYDMIRKAQHEQQQA